MITWTESKPKGRQGRKGFSYCVKYTEDGNLKHSWCNKIFKSVRHAEDSFKQCISIETFKKDSIADIYDVETGEIVLTCG